MRKLLGCLALSVSACSAPAGDGFDSGGSSSGGTLAASGGGSSAGSSSGGSVSSAGTANASGAGGSSSAGTSAVAGGAGQAGAPAGGTSPGVSSKCESPVGAGLPEGAPELTPGTWKDISPAGWPFGEEALFTQGIAFDPCNPAVLYLTVSSFNPSAAGLFKSLDAGSNWTKVGNLDEPIRVRIDPKDTQHLYVGDGVRGGTMGFWVSTDGGDTWARPDGWAAAAAEIGYIDDVYDVAVDPTDFDHVLVSFHSAWGWTDSQWNASAGVLESTDGGDSWIAHAPDGWGAGHAINFLYNPELGLGDSKTWLLGTQGGAGMQRTTDAGETWTKVSETGIQHGGGTIYYTAAGDLFATSGDTMLKSTDNGATWSKVGPGGGYNGIGGDGTKLYTSKCFGPTPFITTTEADGSSWTDFNAQQFDQGSFEVVYDGLNGIVYAGNWTSGIFALKPN